MKAPLPTQVAVSCFRTLVPEHKTFGLTKKPRTCAPPPIFYFYLDNSSLPPLPKQTANFKHFKSAKQNVLSFGHSKHPLPIAISKCGTRGKIRPQLLISATRSKENLTPRSPILRTLPRPPSQISRDSCKWLMFV